MMQALCAHTLSGRVVSLALPSLESILFDDIAEQTARICRYAGAIRPLHYSVAQHSCLVAEACSQLAPFGAADLYGLLHDAHEAYMGDVSLVLETNLSPGAQAEIACVRARLDAAIHTSASLAWPPPSAIAHIVEKAHERVVAAEALCGVSVIKPPPGVMPSTRAISGWPMPKAHENFIKSLNARATREGLTLRVRAP